MSSPIRRFDCADPAQRSAGIEAAAAAVGRGELVVLPTDTVYGIGADAFTPAAVMAMLIAKGRGTHMPSPVLIGSVRAAAALIDDLGVHGQDLIDEFWPGGLTLVCHASRTLSWDLGDTKGTVAVRMPLHPVALELLKLTGPMAVSSANRSGEPPATTVDEAQAQLGDPVAVYLDGGPCAGRVPSSIVDLTGTVPRLLRAGAISAERLRTVAPILDGTAETVVTTGTIGTIEAPDTAGAAATTATADTADTAGTSVPPTPGSAGGPADAASSAGAASPADRADTDAAASGNSAASPADRADTDAAASGNSAASPANTASTGSTASIDAAASTDSTAAGGGDPAQGKAPR